MAPNTSTAQTGLWKSRSISVEGPGFIVEGANFVEVKTPAAATFHARMPFSPRSTSRLLMKHLKFDLDLGMTLI